MRYRETESIVTAAVKQPLETAAFRHPEASLGHMKYGTCSPRIHGSVDFDHSLFFYALPSERSLPFCIGHRHCLDNRETDSNNPLPTWSNRTVKKPPSCRLISICVSLMALLLLNGCSALAVSLAGAGAGAGIEHQVNGTATRTFSESLKRVDSAVNLTTNRLKIKIDSVEPQDDGQVTKGTVGDLAITIELETLSSNLTRVNVTARKNILLLDGATAQEIVAQMERSLNALPRARARTTTSRSRQKKSMHYTPSKATKKETAAARTQNAI